MRTKTSGGAQEGRHGGRPSRLGKQEVALATGVNKRCRFPQSWPTRRSALPLKWRDTAFCQISVFGPYIRVPLGGFRLREPGQACGRKSRKIFSSTGLNLWYNIRVKAKGRIPLRHGKTDFPRGSGFVKPFPRTWDASRESLRNFIGKTHEKDNCPCDTVLPPSVYLSGLSQAPHVMHRRRFRFPPPPMFEEVGKMNNGEYDENKRN